MRRITHKGAIAATQVFDPNFVFFYSDFRMPPRDTWMLDHNVIGGVPANVNDPH
jgi:hypothetical protein